MSEWITTKEAARILNTSVRNVVAKINKGKLWARREGKIWLVNRSLSPPPEEEKGIITESVKNLTESVNYLKDQIEKKDRLLEELRAELDDGRRRSDTIILQLTRQLEQNQRLLEYNRVPWWKRLFRKIETEERR